MKYFVLGIIGILVFLPNAFAQNANPCSTTTGTTAIVQDGLVSTKDGGTSVNNGACVTGPLVPFNLAIDKIGTYANLKSIYYTQAKSSVNKVQIPSPVNQGDFTRELARNDIILVDGNLGGNIDFTTGSPNNPVVVFVEGNLLIDRNIGNNLVDDNPNSGLVFVVKYDVNIHKDVTRVDAVIISEGTICTAYDGVPCASANVTAEPLVINGSLISLKQDKPIKFRRNLADNSISAEKINHQVKYLVILRHLMSQTIQRWSEEP